MMARAGEEIGVNLAVSLHAVTKEVRDEIVPAQPQIRHRAIARGLRRLSRRQQCAAHHLRICDAQGQERQRRDARELVRLIRKYKLPAKVNLIPFNPWPGAPYECSTPTSGSAFSNIVFEAGHLGPVRTPARPRHRRRLRPAQETAAEKKSRGILNQANEVTQTVKVERRLSFQVSLADRLRGLYDPQEVKQAAAELLGRYLGAARIGYAEVDEDETYAFVQADWTRDPEVPSLAGQRTRIAGFGEEAMTFLRAGQPLAFPDIRALPQGSVDRTAAWEAAGVRALITVPLVRESRLKALLYVHEPQPRAWKRSDIAIVRDVAERSWAAVERARAEQSLRDSEDHYRHAVELNPQVAWTSLPDGRLNRVARRWFEWTGTSGLEGSWKDGMHPDDHAVTLGEWDRCLASGEAYDVEHRVRRRDGRYRWARSRAFPRRDAEGNIILWYGNTEDIHERKVAEEHQRLLINELNHRVKNTLASVQAIAFQTLRGEVPLVEARAQFEARLMALSAAHNLLTEENWVGASLERVVKDSTEHLAGDSRRFDVAGEPLRLAPRAALALAMALHELGTNAAKYGALAAEAGRVAIAWTMDGERLHLEWRESGGPPVEAPTRRGFGSRLIERGLEADLGGRAALHFERGGLRCEIEASLAAIRASERPFG
jgi:PAS domain S-box-containing protein